MTDWTDLIHWRKMRVIDPGPEEDAEIVLEQEEPKPEEPKAFLEEP